MVAGDACVGETPAAWISPVTSPKLVAVPTSPCTASREEASTPNPPRDGLTDQTGADDDDHVFHFFCSLFVMLVHFVQRFQRIQRRGYPSHGRSCVVTWSSVSRPFPILTFP